MADAAVIDGECEQADVFKPARKRKHRVKVPPRVLLMVVQDYMDGHSIREAAERSGVSVGTVHGELVRRGVRRRIANNRVKEE